MTLLLIGVYFLGAATPCLAMGLWGLAVWAGLIEMPDNAPVCSMCGAKLSHIETWYCPECEPEWGDEWNYCKFMQQNDRVIGKAA